jgi:hypothetical protein
MIDDKDTIPEIQPNNEPNNPEIQPTVDQNNPQTQPSQPVEETRQAKNFRTIKEKAERAERERDELARRIQEMEASRQQPAPENELGIDNDSYVEGKHIKPIHQEVRKLQEQLKQYQQQSSLAAAEIKLKATYPDFDSVVSKENIELLNDLDPEMAETIKSSSAGIYSKAVAAYKAIKNAGIVTEKNYDAEKRKIQENAAKPRSLASINPQSGDSPLSKAHAFTDTITEEEKKSLYKEMLESRKRVG